jgi:large subunit ribosomal protein L25
VEYRELNVEARQLQGSTAMQRMRKSGLTPAVIYADGSEAQQIAVNTHEFTVLGRRSGHTQLFKLKSADSALDGKIALVKEIQIEPLKGTLLHVDFLGISEGHRITVEVPLKVVGDVAAVKEGRAVINQSAYEIEVECLPTDIPDQIIVEVGHLREGQSIHAAEVKLPEGVVLCSNPVMTVVSVVLAKKEETPAPAAVEAVPVEGAEEAAGKEEEEEAKPSKA